MRMNLLEQSHKKTALQIILLYIFVQLATVLAGQLLPEFLPERFLTEGVIWSQLILFTLGASGVIYLTQKKDFSLSFEKPFKSNISEILLWGFIGFIFALFAQFAATLIEINFLGTPPDSQNTQNIIAIIKRYPYFLLLSSIAGPIMEEFVFRKAIFGMGLNKLGGIGAAVISSLMFAVIHFDGRILVYSTMGLVFSWLYFKTKNIWTPIIAHCLMNTVAVVGNLFFNS